MAIFMLFQKPLHEVNACLPHRSPMDCDIKAMPLKWALREWEGNKGKSLVLGWLISAYVSFSKYIYTVKRIYV